MRLFEKWNDILEQTEKVRGNFSTDNKLTLAQCLETVEVGINRNSGRLNESRDFNTYKKHAFELVTTVVGGNTLIDQIVSVQPLKSRTGEVRYLKFIYGDNKGLVKAGQSFSDALGLANGVNPNYSSEDIDYEFLGKTGDTAPEITRLSWFPVRPGSVSISFGGTAPITDDGNGGLVSTQITAGGTIDYATGDVHYTLSAPATEDHIANYSYVLDSGKVNAPRIDVKVDWMPMVARTRKLKAVYCFDDAFDLDQDYGFEISTDTIANTGAEIRHEINGEVMNDLYKQAGLSSAPWSAIVPPGVSYSDHAASFYQEYVRCGNMIFQATQRFNSSFIICGTIAANIIESMPQFRSVTTIGTVGPHLSGYLNGSVPVYKNPYYNPEDYLVGFRGEGLADSGYIYAPYMPVVSTDLIVDANFQGSKGFATAYGKKMVNPKLYVRGRMIFK